jgi:hypothetical protein
METSYRFNSPRKTTRDRNGEPYIELAENALWLAALHVAMCRDDPGSRFCDSARWDLEQAEKHLAATDGPRNVRTRALRLSRRLARLKRVCVNEGELRRVARKSATRRMR